MGNHLRSCLFTLTFVLLLSSLSHAAGFALYEFSARGNSLGGAMVARADDASAVAWNPAGITQLEGAQAMAGATLIYPRAKIEAGGDSEQGSSNPWYPPHAYYTQQINDDLWFGVGSFSRFGLASEYDREWFGRYNNVRTAIKSVSLNPVLAYKLDKRFSLAAGPEIMWFEFSQKKNTPNPLVAAAARTPENDVNAKLLGDSWGVGLTLAAHAMPTDWLKLGFTYRSQMKQYLRGRATFDRSSVPVTAATASWYPDTDAKGRIILPDMFFFGAEFTPFEDLSAEIGFVYTRWSTYKSLNIKYATEFLPGRDSTFARKSWSDVWRFNVGLEYALTDNWDLRGGYVYDESPVNDDYADYLVPTNDRQIFSGGLGWHNDQWSVDASYSYLWIKTRDFSNTQTAGVLKNSRSYDGDAHLVGLSVGYKF